jgi:hypothetical protein
MYPKVSGLGHKEIYAYPWYYSLRSNIKGYGGKTHYTGSQNSDTTAHSGRELQVVSPETFGHTLCVCVWGGEKEWNKRVFMQVVKKLWAHFQV